MKIIKMFLAGLGLIFIFSSSIVAFADTTGIYPIGQLFWDQNWTGNHFSCGTGYVLKEYHYDCHCSNNATWYACVKP